MQKLRSSINYEKQNFSSQICVEFDELHLINEKSSKRFIQTYNLLIENGYNMVETNEHPNFLFIRKEKLV